MSKGMRVRLNKMKRKTNKVIIRPAVMADMAELIKLRIAMVSACPDSFLDDYGELSEWSAADWGSWFSRLTENPNSRLLVGQAGEELVGIVGCKGVSHKRASHVATLVGVGVLPQFRNQGIGKKLLQEIIGWVKTKTGIKRLQLTVYADNLPAISFYEKLGFKKEGLFKDYAKSVDGHYQDGVMMAMFF